MVSCVKERKEKKAFLFQKTTREKSASEQGWENKTPYFDKKIKN